MKFSIRLLYLYLFSFVGLIVVVIGSVQIVDLGIKALFFKDADIYNYARPKVICPQGETCPEEISDEENLRLAKEEAARNRQRRLSNSLAMIIVGAPLYIYHWGVIKKEKKYLG